MDGSPSDRTRPRPARMAHRGTGRDPDTHGWPIEGQDEASTHMDGPSRDRMRPRRTRMARRGTGWEQNRRGDKKNAPNDPARGGLKRCGSSGDVRLGWGEGGIRGSHSKKEVRGVSVVSRGFEPLQTEPKPVVLPLHHETSAVVIFLTPQKYTRGAFLQVLGLLFCNQEVVILLSALNEEVFSGD